MSARSKRGATAKVSFFAFQDIITCVSGVLIVITLLMSTMLSDEEVVKTKPSTKQAQATLADLRIKNDKLTKELSNIPDPEAIGIETEELKRRLDDLKKVLAALTDKKARQNEIDKLGEKNVQKLERMIADILDKIKGLEDQIKAQKTKNAEEATAWTLVPQLPDNSRKPVLVVVSGDGATVEEFGRPDSRQEIAKSGLQLSFASALTKFSSSANYFVFYVKPSGIAPFLSLEAQAKQAGFQTGFDALLENVNLKFSKPKP